MKVIDKDGNIYEVRKYIKADNGTIHIWCNKWYGHHIVGVDCEFHKIYRCMYCEKDIRSQDAIILCKKCIK